LLAAPSPKESGAKGGRGKKADKEADTLFARPTIAAYRKLAANRDLQIDDERHFACGFNPQGTADDTLLVGRITAQESSQIIGTLVNYACHPTTLAWENTLISPDYVGTLRTTIERDTGGAPCLFLQGASGELSARDCHQGRVEVAERQGRQVGYAALSTLAGMIPAGEQLNYGGIKESGAKLAYWRPGPLEPTPQMREVVTEQAAYAMPIKPEWPTLAEFERLWAETEDRVMKERYLRRMGSRRRVGDGTPGRLFRSHIARRTYHTVPSERAVGPCKLGDPEVDNLVAGTCLRFLAKDVVRFDVPMDDAR